MLGGTGQVGSAAALRLACAGWDVTSSGRAAARFPQDLRDAGVRFVQSDRYAAEDLRQLLHEGADVVVDCVGYTAEHVRMLLPAQQSIGSLVFISSKAVYVDDHGRHSNSAEPPEFAAAVTEEQPTMTPSDIDYNSPAGYGANKVAAEHVLLDSGMAVSVLRPSRIHGIGGTRPREWVFVKRVLDGRRYLLLARGGRGINHPTAALNLAALVEFCAARPGTRILNSADPDAPDGLAISRAIAAHLAHTVDRGSSRRNRARGPRRSPVEHAAALRPGHVRGAATRIRPRRQLCGDGHGRARLAGQRRAVGRPRRGAAVIRRPVLPVVLPLLPGGCLAGRS